jgi:hypothetical protein
MYLFFQRCPFLLLPENKDLFLKNEKEQHFSPRAEPVAK